MNKRRLMVVDDSSIMRTVILSVLSDDPMVEVVAFASNGREALGKLGSARPDLILLDIEMPVMDGLEFLRHARLKSRAKVVVLSSVAAVGSEKAAQAMALGANAIVSKPSGAISFDLEEKRGSELRRVIYEVLDIKQF